MTQINNTRIGGMKLDKYKLEYEMKSRGISIEMLCNAVNISRSAFYSGFSTLQNYITLYKPQKCGIFLSNFLNLFVVWCCILIKSMI